MTRHIQLVSAKGGQGISTTVAILAQGFSNEGLTVAVVDNGGDLRSVLGVAYTDNPKTYVSSNVTWYNYGVAPVEDIVIWDNCKPIVNTYETYVVTRNCYMAIRRNIDVPADGVIVIEEPDRALRVSDVESVLSKPAVLTIPVTPMISRKVDAGLSSKLPGHTLPVLAVSSDK